MSAWIAGMGWVTPLGTGLAEVCERVQRGETAERKSIVNPETGREMWCAPVPPKLVEHLGRHPRLRRSSPISYFAVAAALAALDDAGLDANAARTAIVFATSDGSVLYTRRFYEQVVKQGANAASPLLFPETVYNAPASHLAALLGIDGASYTLVGDATVGFRALKMAEQLLDMDAADRCVVVGCEELDWVLCQAYRDWRLGALLAEGAAALVLAREGRCELRSIHDGVPFFRRKEAAPAIKRAVREVGGASAEMVVSCGNGTFIDAAEATALNAVCAKTPRHFPKQSLGEAPGASALMQVVYAAQTLASTALVPVLGFNHQASAALLTRAAR